MTAPIHGGFTEAEMGHILEHGCAQAGLDATGAVLLRGQTNAVLRLVAHPVIVKIARKGTPAAEVSRTTIFVRWLMDMGFPTVPLYQPHLQPLQVDGHALTLWEYLPQPAHPVPAHALAKPLNILHSLSEPPLDLPSADVCGAIRSSLRRTEILSEQDRHYLTRRVDILERQLTAVRYDLPGGVLQGDPQHGNALHEGNRAVLCDWDSIAYGHPEWDLVTVEVHCRRFGHGAAHYDAFAEAYGWDVTRWSGYPVLRDLRELRMITTNARKATHEPAKAAEVRRRISVLREQRLTARWHIL
ncbi:phosphotransferase family protein [Streptomyces sp. CA-294286]|uniref:phosphotransferase family protein n=1 Tax=Streptomyces sp. CA-294286 TaxID=3240070 RepID=UPI003D92150B